MNDDHGYQELQLTEVLPGGFDNFSMSAGMSQAKRVTPTQSTGCLAGHGNRRPQKWQQRQANPEAEASPLEKMPNDGLAHSALCDVCGAVIRGTRFKCRQCTDYDLCFHCLSKVTAVHFPEHAFRAIHFPPGALPHRPACLTSDMFCTTLVCDGCDAAIKGHSYRCLNCPDYDLCVLCEVVMECLHDETHVFAKLRRPAVRPIGTTCALLGGLNIYDEGVIARVRGAACERCEVDKLIQCRDPCHSNHPQDVQPTVKETHSVHTQVNALKSETSSVHTQCVVPETVSKETQCPGNSTDTKATQSEQKVARDAGVQTVGNPSEDIKEETLVELVSRLSLNRNAPYSAPAISTTPGDAPAAPDPTEAGKENEVEERESLYPSLRPDDVDDGGEGVEDSGDDFEIVDLDQL